MKVHGPIEAVPGGGRSAGWFYSPWMKVHGPIEAGRRNALNGPFFHSPWMKVHGPIEANSLYTTILRFISTSPWMKVHGPIEALKLGLHLVGRSFSHRG